MKDTTHRCFLALPVKDRMPYLTLDMAGTAFRKRLTGALGNAFARETGGFHLMLRFLGALTAEQMHRLMNLESLAGHHDPPIGFDLSLTEFRTFDDPNDGSPRVLYVAIDGAEEALLTLRGLAERAERLAQKVGCPPADCPFTPHVTLGRFTRPLTDAEREDVKALSQSLPSDSGMPVSWRVQSGALMESVQETDPLGRRVVRRRTVSEGEFLMEPRHRNPARE